nr:hypothetical protein [Bacillus thuringiensis]
MGIIHKKGKEELAFLREQHRSISENLISILSEVLETTDMHDDNTQIGSKITELLEEFYKNHRKTLFRLITLLEIDSTTQDDSLIHALKFLL